jgi:hypothetical protein
MLLLALLLALALPAACRHAGGPPADLDISTTRLSDRGLYRVTIHPGQEPIPSGPIHSWTLHVESAAGDALDDADIRVRGGMPEHGHGLPTAPQVTAALGGGDYLVEGMKFNMGGWWTLTFDITVNGESDSVTFNLIL